MLYLEVSVIMFLPICSWALESLAERLTQVAVQQMMYIFALFSYLTIAQANFCCLSEYVVNLSPLWREGRIACPKGRRLCLIVACGHQC